MRLGDYLELRGMTLAGFAKEIDVANGKVVERYAKGARIPRRDIMLRIVAATSDAVGPADFYREAAE